MINKSIKIITVGQASNKNSQGGKIYSVEGIFPTICACTHGYAIGYILEKVKSSNDNTYIKEIS